MTGAVLGVTPVGIGVHDVLFDHEHDRPQLHDRVEGRRVQFGEPVVVDGRHTRDGTCPVCAEGPPGLPDGHWHPMMAL